MEQTRRTIETGLAALGVAADEEAMSRLIRYLAELDRWNARYGFIKAAAGELIALHLLDALAGLALLRKTAPGGTILDFGSGAGFPGLPLAVMMPARRFVLCERKATENAFLSNMAALLGLTRVTVIDRLSRQPPASVAAVVFRAVMTLKEIEPLVRGCLAPGGVLFAYKGTRAKIDEEIASLAAAAPDLKSDVHRLSLPGEKRERHIVVVRRLPT